MVAANTANDTEMPTIPLLAGFSCFSVTITPSQAGCTYSRFSRLALACYDNRSLLRFNGGRNEEKPS